MRDFIKVMKALSDPNRVRMLKLLLEKELCVCELNAMFPLSQPGISKHLRVLEEAELVTFRKQGNWAIYRIVEESRSVHAREMLRYLDGVELEDNDLEALKGSLAQVDRERLGAA